jgi:apolipoprotein N-acyltransferase
MARRQGQPARNHTPGLARVVALAVAISTAEWLRGHILTGFPWNVLGYALTHPLVLMQSSGLVGVYGLTLLCVLVFALPAAALVGPRDGLARLSGAAVSAAILLALTAYGTMRLAAPEPPAVAGVRLRLVQPSVPQREKWRPERQREFFLEHLDLSIRRPDGTPDNLGGITHVVWPEAAMPFQPLRTPEALQMIAATLPAGVHLISGALRSEIGAAPGSRLLAFNSLMVFGPDGALAGLYDKTHLVPFGEYLPFQETMESIGIQQLTRQRGGFTEGRTPRPLLVVPGLPLVGPLICYEAIFPAAVIAGADRPGVLVNVTNDGWFGTGPGPYQHFHQARVRAVEEGMPLVRAANNGISALIDARGRVRGRLELNQKGTLDVELPAAVSPPLYALWRDGLLLVTSVLTLLGLAFSSVHQH